MKAEADARAYEIKAIARAEAEVATETKNIQIAAVVDRIQSMLRDHPELAERARQRLLAREIEGQLNVESIADSASQSLPAAVT